MSILWFEGDNYSILSLPFVCYSVSEMKEPFLGKYEVSHKASFPIFDSLDHIYKTREDAKKACEVHLKKILKYMFSKLQDVLVIETTMQEEKI